ncbi:hypothetical protein D9M71_462590 [compost metagenome]
MQEQVGLLLVRPVQARIAEHIVGPQAAGPAFAPLAPVQRPRTLCEQRRAGLGEGLATAVPARQFVGQRAQTPDHIDLAIHAQTAADTAQRTLRVESLDAFLQPIVDDLGAGKPRQDLQIAAARHIGPGRRGHQGERSQRSSHAGPHRVGIACCGRPAHRAPSWLAIPSSLEICRPAAVAVLYSSIMRILPCNGIQPRHLPGASQGAANRGLKQSATALAPASSSRCKWWPPSRRCRVIGRSSISAIDCGWRTGMPSSASTRLTGQRKARTQASTWARLMRSGDGRVSRGSLRQV